jgi:transposase
MAIRAGNREQMQMLPASIEEYVSGDAPVRVYDAFVEALDLDDLGIQKDLHKEGNPSYDPKAMLKLLVYGYSYGVRSSRKLEREVNYNLSFMWLMGGLKPDFKTIAEFRRKNKGALTKVLKQSVRMCIKLDLISGNILFVDGSKIRANASIKNTWSLEKCDKALAKIDKKIERLIAESESLDGEENGLPSLVTPNHELTDAKAIQERVKGIMAELQESGQKTLNTVDRECARTNGVHGTHAGYNAQLVTDDKNGLIVSSDVVANNNDLGQFSKQIAKAQEETGIKCEIGVADSGYAYTDDLAKIDRQGIQVIVPRQRAVSGKPIGEFDKRSFLYDTQKDCYICPRGKILKRSVRTTDKSGYRYHISKRAFCLRCPAFGRCTTAKMGRVIERLAEEALRERLDKELSLPENREIYNRRQQKAELVYGHIKRNLGVSGFLLRGLAGVKAETSLLSSCFNLRRMMTLLGITGLIQELRRVGSHIFVNMSDNFVGKINVNFLRSVLFNNGLSKANVINCDTV